MPNTFTTRGILFDMDGVLISSTDADIRSWTRWAALRGIHDFDLRSTHGRRATDTLASLRPDLDPASEIALLESFDAEDLSGILVLPGVHRLLASLPPPSWTIVTSASQRLIENRLRQAGLATPATSITAESVSHGKPRPAPYLAGADALHLAPADCLVIEDSPAGVASGKAAGCRVLAVLTSHAPAELSAADYIVPSLEDITATLLPDGLLEIVLQP